METMIIAAIGAFAGVIAGGLVTGYGLLRKFSRDSDNKIDDLVVKIFDRFIEETNDAQNDNEPSQ